YGPETWRRSIYAQTPRAVRDDLLGGFDCPESSQREPRRDVTTTPLQALTLLNGPFAIQQAVFMADRLRHDAGSSPEAQIRLACLLSEGAGAAPSARPLAGPLTPKPPHFPAKAKRVVQIFCPGAVSHLDTFEYKPELIRMHGQPLPGAEKIVTFQGSNGNLMRSPWAWAQHGQSGKWVSDLLP